MLRLWVWVRVVVGEWEMKWRWWGGEGETGCVCEGMDGGGDRGEGGGRCRGGGGLGRVSGGCGRGRGGVEVVMRLCITIIALHRAFPEHLPARSPHWPAARSAAPRPRPRCPGAQSRRRRRPAQHIRPYGLSDLQSSVLISLFIQHLAMTTNQQCGEAVRVEPRSDWCSRGRGHAHPPAATNHRAAAARGVLEVFKLHHCPRLQG